MIFTSELTVKGSGFRLEVNKQFLEDHSKQQENYEVTKLSRKLSRAQDWSSGSDKSEGACKYRHDHQGEVENHPQL